MGTFSFKSSGTTRAQQALNQLVVSPTPIGILTPLSFGESTLFNVSYSVAEQAHDNLRNLLLTNWGERLGQYNFGANLRPLVTEMVSQDDFDAQAVERISNAVGKWMPYITLENFISEIDRNGNRRTAVINLTVTYGIPALNVSKKALQVTLYAL